MKKMMLVLCLCFYLFEGNGQNIQLNDFGYKNGVYDIMVIKADSNFYKSFRIISNRNLLTEAALFDSLGRNHSVFAINAGIVDSTCNFLGLYIDSSLQRKPINLNNGQGNFYLKPNGYLAVSKDSFLLSNTQKYDSTLAPIWAVQSGPMLIDSMKINSQINPNSTNKNFRCGVGTFRNNSGSYLVFINSKVPVSFYNFASLFAEKYNCENALTLESGILATMILPKAKGSYSKTRVVCNYIFFNLN